MPYKVAKAGIVHYTRVLAAELGPYGIHVNCIAPGLILSSRAVAQGRNSEESRRQSRAADSPAPLGDARGLRSGWWSFWRPNFRITSPGQCILRVRGVCGVLISSFI